MTDIKQFIRLLNDKDIRLSIVQGYLKVNAPKGSLDNAIISHLKEYKKEIIRFLNENSTSAKTTEMIEPVSRKADIPASYMQKQMWLVNKLEDKIAIYHIPFTIKIKGKTDVDTLEKALRYIINRHEILRTTFYEKNNDIFQKINSEIEFDFQKSDASVFINNGISIIAKLRQFISERFDPEKKPLFRTLVITNTRERNTESDWDYIFTIVFHQLIADGWTVGIFMDELIHTYQCMIKNEKPQLPELKIQYADFAFWQIEKMKNNGFDKHITYWQNQLKNLPKSCNIMPDFPRKRKHSFQGKRHYFNLNKELTDKIRTLANKEDVSVFMLLISTYALLLNKHTAMKDIPIGAPVANRPYSILERTIGSFVNAIVIRFSIDTSLTYKEFLQKSKIMILEAFQHQEIPFELVVKNVAGERTQAHAPLFDNMFTLQNMPIEKTDIDDITLEPMEIDFGVAHFDVTTAITEAPDFMRVLIEYNDQIFRQETIKSFAEHFVNLLSGIIDNPTSGISELKIISTEEKRTILEKFNPAINDDNSDKQNIVSLFEETVSKHPDKPALLFKDKELTYTLLNQQVNKTAHFLIKKGLRQGDIAGIMLERSVDAIVYILAILKAGAGYLPLDPDTPSQRLHTILENSNLKLLISSEKIIDKYGFTFLQLLDCKYEVNIIQNAPREPVSDLDTLPFPDRTLVDYKKYHKFIGIAPTKNSVTLLASRGCPFKCLFCHKIWPKKQIMRSAENLFQEFKQCYDAGIRRFNIIDDIFNLQEKIAVEFFELVIKNAPGAMFTFSNGLRGDILTKDFIDLMVEAGARIIAFALETGSPRLQKLLRKNMNIPKLQENVQYITQKHPQVMLDMQLLFGLPSETKEEAMQTLEVLKSMKWITFPNFHILKIYPNTEIHRLALEMGISNEAIWKSTNLRYHELPETLPYGKEFMRIIQSTFMNEYLLVKQRAIHALTAQMNSLTESEIYQKYDSFLPDSINSLDDVFKYFNVTQEDFGDLRPLPEERFEVPDFNEKMKKYFPSVTPEKKRLKILLLDLSILFTSAGESMLHTMIEEPIGLMYILTSLKQKFGGKIDGKVLKAKVDFNSYTELISIIKDFQPEIIGCRTLSLYRDFFHETISIIKQNFPNITIVGGGPYASSEYSSLLKDNNIDLIVIGEGEVTFNEIIEKYIESGYRLPDKSILEEIKGIAFRKDTYASAIKMIVADYAKESIQVESDSSPEVRIRSDLPAYLLYTSGSTGVPKGVLMPHKAAINLIAFHHTDALLSKTETTAQFAAQTFDVSFQEIFTALTTGAALHIVDNETRRNPEKLLHFIIANNIERLFLPYVALHQLALIAYEKNTYPTSLRNIITAGEQLKITNEIRDFFLHIPKCRLHNHYGPTEAHVVSTHLLDANPYLWKELPPIGKPIHNVNLLTLDKSGNLQPVGVPGELYIAGVCLALGYNNNQELTESNFIENPIKEVNSDKLYKTGDLARWLPDGNIEFLGRKDNQIKLRGFRIEIGEIENAISKYPNISEIVVALANKDSDAFHLIAFYTLKNTAADIEKNQLREFLLDYLPEYMIPAEFVKLDTFAFTPSGKIDRKQLSLNKSETLGIDIVTPKNNIEEILLNIYKNVLKRNDISVNDNFFLIGGHSLLATQVLTRIKKHLFLDFPLRIIFEFPSVRQLSRYIQRNGDDESSTAFILSKVTEHEQFPISHFQKRIYLFDEQYPGQSVHNIYGALKLKGTVNLKILNDAFTKVLEEHSILRTKYKKQQDTIYQYPVEIYGELIEVQEGGALTDSELFTTIQEFCTKLFDLSAQIPIRLKLLTLKEDTQILAYSIHHIAIDGWSMPLFTDKLTKYYNTLLKRNSVNNTSEFSYFDFSKSHNNWLKNLDIDDEVRYWKEKFAAFDTKYSVSQSSFDAETLQFSFDERLSKNLRNFAAKNNSSLFIVLLTGLYVLLSEKTEEEQIVITTSSANRFSDQIEEIIGYFVNHLPMIFPPVKQVHQEEVLNFVKREVLETFAHQHIPIEIIFEKLGYDPIENPFYKCMFVLQSNLSPALSFDGVEVSGYSLNSHQSQYEMLLTMFNDTTHIRGGFTYNTSVFSQVDIEMLCKRYHDILAAMVNNLDK